MLDRMLLSAGGEEKLYVEDVFSTYLYTGNGSSQTINNGIDLSGKGGMVWIKQRNALASHAIFDTNRGTERYLSSNTTDAASGRFNNTLTSFTSSGFALGNDTTLVNNNGSTYCSWSFRKNPKFFDVVTWTSSGGGAARSHSLGVQPGCIIVKATSAGSTDWYVWHRSLTNQAQYYLKLNTTDAQASAFVWNNTAPTATQFSVSGVNNTSGRTYVAYLFAHDATADGIIQCGSFTTDASGNATVNLGWEPQWLTGKCASLGGPWYMADNMRGMSVTSDAYLLANSSGAEGISTPATYSPTATGFTAANLNGSATYIYIAIRRGPMKTPTVGTSVFSPIARTPTSSRYSLTSNPFTVDAVFAYQRSPLNSASQATVWDRLRGATKYVVTSSVAAEDTSSGISSFAVQNGYTVDYGSFANLNWLPENQEVYWNFRRAPGFFDVVCYTGTGNPLTLNHNLGVAPELIIYKARSSGYSWIVQSSAMNVVSDYLILNATSAKGTTMTWRTPTSTTFGVNMSGNVSECNYAGTTYVAYLFASCPGVSKVGSYTGNGTSQTINCGFSSGARFFLVKRTDDTGTWWVYDSARGIVAAADPALRLNATTVEVTSADAVDTESTGIIVNQESICNINVNGATYIYLAIA